MIVVLSLRQCHRLLAMDGIVTPTLAKDIETRVQCTFMLLDLDDGLLNPWLLCLDFSCVAHIPVSLYIINNNLQ